MGKNRNVNTNKVFNRKNKVHLSFDTAARKEFLTGFHARKLQRKKKAQEEFEKQLKEEKKRLKQEAKKAYRDLIHSHQPIHAPDELESEEMNMENHCVKICELSTAEISLKNNLIGENQVEYDDGNESTSEKPDNKSNAPEIPLKNKSDLKKLLKKKASQNAKKSKPLQKQMEQQTRKNKKKSRKKNMLISKLLKNKSKNKV